jgi:A/G-specific adenine glycosylase
MTLPASTLADRVVRWQRSHGRHTLPWQNTRDPYRVWLSEIMLQQTQVSTVLGYYARFLERFPDVRVLAAADEDAVMASWSGLGYYSRARNLHRCAQEVMARFGGVFPATAQELQTLPGIGRSTAAAIASFCFGERVAILDANVKRVLTRALGFGQDLALSASEQALWLEAEALLPVDDLAQSMPRYTQGLMDLGAGICLPRKPACLLCPLHDICAARREGAPERYPMRTKKLKRTAETWWLLLARDREGRIWLQRRPAPGIWAGLYSPPAYAAYDVLLSEAGAQQAVRELPSLLHALTHKDLYLRPVLVRYGDGRAPAAPGGWWTLDQAQAQGLPAPVRKLLAAGLPDDAADDSAHEEPVLNERPVRGAA